MQGEYILNGVNPELARRMRAAISATEAQGIPVIVRSGLRDYQTQVNLWNRRASNPYPVARPGFSPHEWGVAVDARPVHPTANGWAILWRNAAAAGLVLGHNFRRRDDVHFELPGFIHGADAQPGLAVYGVYGKPGSGGPVTAGNTAGNDAGPVNSTVTIAPIAAYNAVAVSPDPTAYGGLAIAAGLGVLFIFLLVSD